MSRFEIKPDGAVICFPDSGESYLLRCCNNPAINCSSHCFCFIASKDPSTICCSAHDVVLKGEHYPWLKVLDLSDIQDLTVLDVVLRGSFVYLVFSSNRAFSFKLSDPADFQKVCGLKDSVVKCIKTSFSSEDNSPMLNFILYQGFSSLYIKVDCLGA